MRIIILILFCLRLSLMNGKGVEPTREAHPILRAATPPVIDGKLNDDCWKRARPILVVYPHGGTGKATDPAPMTAWVSWDADYLYLAYEVTDTDLVALGTGRESGPPNNRRPQCVEYAPAKNLDLAEFFICLGSNQFFWEIHHNAANHLNTLWIQIPSPGKLAEIQNPVYKDVTFHRNRYLPDQGANTLKRAVRLKNKPNGQPSTINQPGDRDSGYFGEMRLPWAGLMFDRTPFKGTHQLTKLELSILAVNLNGNKGQAKYHSSGSNLPHLMYHFTVPKWPVYKLVE